MSQATKKVKVEGGGAAAVAQVAYSKTYDCNFPLSLDDIAARPQAQLAIRKRTFKCAEGLQWMVCIDTVPINKEKRQYKIDAFLFCLSVPVPPGPYKKSAVDQKKDPEYCKWLEAKEGEWDAAAGKAYGVRSNGVNKGPADAVFFEEVTLQLVTKSDCIGKDMKVRLNNYSDDGFGCLYHAGAAERGGAAAATCNYKGVGATLKEVYNAKQTGSQDDDDNVTLCVTFHDQPRPLQYM